MSDLVDAIIEARKLYRPACVFFSITRGFYADQLGTNPGQLQFLIPSNGAPLIPCNNDARLALSKLVFSALVGKDIDDYVQGNDPYYKDVIVPAFMENDAAFKWKEARRKRDAVLYGKTKKIKIKKIKLKK